MNIIHLKYAIEVAKVGSINKASENLGMAQPNISRAIKDLEAGMGITIFDRSAKGMNLTPEGKELIDYAQKILHQLNELENMYKDGGAGRQKFSISAPRAGYIAEAFAEFSAYISGSSANISFKETGAHNTIKNVVSSDCKLGIIRYEESADRYFKEILAEKNLVWEEISDFGYMVMMSKESTLASLEELTESDLQDKIQITHSDPYAATLTATDSQKDELQEYSHRCIYILDSAAQFELMSENPDTFMWVSPAPQKLLDRYGLIQRTCADNKLRYKDVLIYRRDYKLSELDRQFADIVIKAAKAHLQ